MGDRCIILIEDSHGLNDAACYLHWAGSEAIELIKEAIPCMRKGDSTYSLARLIGFLHTKIKGNLSLGCFGIDVQKPLSDISNGDAGIVVYNCETGIINCAEGYLSDRSGENLGVPPNDFY